MSESLEVIIGDELNKIEVRVPKALLDIADGIDKINAKPISLKGLTEMAAAAKDLQGQLSAIYDTITEEQQKAALALQRLAKANKDNADATIKNTKAENERLKGVVLQAKADEASAKALLANTKAQDLSTKATEKQTQATQTNAQAIKARNEELAKRKIEDIPLEIKNETQLLNENTEAKNRNTSQSAENIAQNEASNAATTRQIPLTQAATAATTADTSATAAATPVKMTYAEQEAAVKAATEQTTTATKKKTEAQKKDDDTNKKSISGVRGLWSSLRQLAYILPGIGIAGIFAAIFAGINEIYVAATSANKGAKESQEGYNKSVEEGSKALGNEIGELERIQGLLTDNSKTRGEITAEVSALASKYPEYISFLVAEQGSMADINSAINEQINLLRARSLETAARKEAKDAEASYEEAIQKVTESLTQNAKWYQNVIGFVTGNSGANVAYIQSMADVATAIERVNRSRQRESDVITDNIALLTRASLDRRIEIDEITNQTTGSDKLNSSQLSAIEVRKQQIHSINELIDYYKQLREAALNANSAEDSQVNNDAKYWQARVNIAKKGSKDLVSASSQLANANRDKELADLKNKYIVEKRIREQDLADNQTYQTEVFLINSKAIKAQNDAKDLYDRKNRPKRQQDPVNEIIAAQKRLTDAERDAEVERLNQSIANNDLIFQNEKTSEDKRAAAYAEMFDARLEIARINRDKEIQDVNDWIAIRQTEIDKANATEKSKQTEHQKALLIDEEAMFVRRRAAEMKYRADVAEINRDSLVAVEKLIADFDDKALTREQKQAKEDLDITARYFKQKKDYYKTQADAEKKYYEDTARNIEYGALAVDTLTKLYDIQSKKRIDQIDAQKTALDSQLQTEIDGINATTDSEEKKQQDIKDAQGRTAAAKKELDDEERKRKISQAKTDKALSILQIILNTAAAVTKLLYAPPLAIAAGIAGAAQLAIAVATPIPQYAKGVEYKPTSGLMYVGDGGERELIEHPDGRMEWSKDTATLMYGAKGTRVTPESILMRDIYNGQSSLNSGSIGRYNDAMMQQVMKSNKSVVSAIKNMPRTSVTIDKHGYNMSHQEGNAHTTYINRKINL